MQIYRIRKFPSKTVILFFIAVVIFSVPKLRAGFKNFAFDILAKPFGLITNAKSYLTKVKDISEENLSLKQRLAMQSVLLARMKEVSLENERLGALLDFEKSLPYNSRVARVIGRDPSDWRQSVIINKGEEHGIRPHMPCATAEGVAGSVLEVTRHSSKVMLVTDPNSRIGVVVGPSRESGVLVGFSRGACKVLYLSIDSRIEKGDNVVTAGFSAFFPKGLSVGEVTDTAVDETRLYKYAIVRPAVKMNKIEEVICIDAEK